MGFDVYGLNPQINTEKPEALVKYDNLDNKWKDMTDKQRDEYYKLEDQFKAENPGIYFRANVWGWRPIWGFVCRACDDFLSADDMEKGMYNDSRKISKTKSVKIAKRLSEYMANGMVDDMERHNAIEVAEAKIHNDKMKEKMDSVTHDLIVSLALNDMPYADAGKLYKKNPHKFQKEAEHSINIWMTHGEKEVPVPRDYPKEYYTKWSKHQSNTNWADHYPFRKTEIERFAKFCLESGGFEIC